MAPLHSQVKMIKMRCNMIFLGHVIPLALVLAHDANGIKWYHCIPYFKMIKMRCKRCFLVMWCHWYWCHYHLITTASSITPLHSLGQDNWNDMLHDFLVMWCHWHWCHMMPLALASAQCDADGIINGTTGYLRSRQLQWSATWHF